MTTVKNTTQTSESPIDEANKIWRYSDFTMFVSMLENNGLFFRRASFLEDTFEGSIPVLDLQRRHNEIRNLFDDPTIKEAEWVHEKARLEKYGTSAGVMQQMEYQHKAQIETLQLIKAGLIKKHGNEEEAFKEWAIKHHRMANTAFNRHTFLINSWHLNEYESAAMWKLYGREEKSICIQSTVGKLRACVYNTAFVVPVRYIDYDVEALEESQGTEGTYGSDPRLQESGLYKMYFPFLHKRRSFEHERELRAIFTSLAGFKSAQAYTYEKALKELPSGQWITVNLDNLIEGVFIDPSAPEWFRELVTKLMYRYGLKKMVHHSTLNKGPVF